MVQQRPMIGISGLLQPMDTRQLAGVPQTYVDAVAVAGGLPVILPPGLPDATLRDWLARLDGLVLSGGPDVDPRCYGAAPHPALGRTDPARDALDLALARAALSRPLPVLAICRGAQVLAVAAGGGLYQDIAAQVPAALRHQVADRRRQAVHDVEIAPATLLRRLVGASGLPVNSIHHQAICRLPPGWRPAAHAPDGVLEAYEVPGHPFGLAVQWHPEDLAGTWPAHAALFAGLVRSCRAGD